MRVLLLTNSYPPVLGGLQTVVHTLARRLSQRGHTVRVVTQRYPRSLPEDELLDEVPVKRWLCLTPNLHYLRQGRPDLFGAALAVAPLTFLRVARLMHTFQPEVINLHFPEAHVPFVLGLRRFYQFRLVVSLHGNDVEGWDGIDRNDGRFRRWRAVLRRADAVTACSRALLDEACALEPSLKHKGRVIHNGVDLTRFSKTVSPYPHPRPYCLAYGRLTHKKGFDLLLEAFARLSPQHPAVDLILAGTGEAHTALRSQASRLGIVDRVKFFGRASEAEVAQLLKGCLFAVVPSRQESFGIVVLEAIAAGTPVLATCVGGIPELVAQVFALQPADCRRLPTDGAHPYVVQDGRSPVRLARPTVDDLSQALGEWLDRAPRDSTREALSPNQLSAFSWERMVDAYENVLRGD